MLLQPHLPLFEAATPVLHLRPALALLVSRVVGVWLNQLYLLLLGLLFHFLALLSQHKFFRVVVKQVRIECLIDLFEPFNSWRVRLIAEKPYACVVLKVFMLEVGQVDDKLGVVCDWSDVELFKVSFVDHYHALEALG